MGQGFKTRRIVATTVPTSLKNTLCFVSTLRFAEVSYNINLLFFKEICENLLKMSPSSRAKNHCAVRQCVRRARVASLHFLPGLTRFGGGRRRFRHGRRRRRAMKAGDKQFLVSICKKGNIFRPKKCVYRGARFIVPRFWTSKIEPKSGLSYYPVIY